MGTEKSYATLRSGFATKHEQRRVTQPLRPRTPAPATVTSRNSATAFATDDTDYTDIVTTTATALFLPRKARNTRKVKQRNNSDKALWSAAARRRFDMSRSDRFVSRRSFGYWKFLAPPSADWIFASAVRRACLLTTFYCSPFSRSAVSPEFYCPHSRRRRAYGELGLCPACSGQPSYSATNLHSCGGIPLLSGFSRM